ncbi:MAG: acetate--CoA ligase family protein [Actinomycetota bacterium]|nr:acetate--CoA ligase family protein [Actinomycetota bacterium]
MKNLSLLWNAQSVAIIGATERENAMGRAPIEYLQRYGYAGKIYPINPKSSTILGLQAFAKITEVKAEIDLALIMLPAGSVEAALVECGEAGVKIVIVMSSGFAESDEAGELAQMRLVEIAKRTGMRLVGPNCIGSVGGAKKLVASFSPVFSSPTTVVESGNVALVSQSGALGYGMYSLGIEQGVPLGVVVTTGNEADVTNLEVANVLADDPSISAILLYAESLADIEALRRISAKKPTAILKVGRSRDGATAAASHTGALATEDRIIDAAIKTTGAVRVDNVEQLLDAGSIFATGLKSLGKRVAIITTSGGSGILATDALESNGLELAELAPESLAELRNIIPSYGNANNPVDVTAAVMSSPDLFEKCLELLAKDAGVDSIIACFAVLVGNDVERIASALGGVKQIRNIPIAVARTGSKNLAPHASAIFKQFNLPVYPTPDRAVTALRILNDSGQVIERIKLRNSSEKFPTPSDTATEVEMKELWRSLGVPVPLSVVVRDESQIQSAIEFVGGRAVLKAVIPGLLHKSEAGAVALDITAINAQATYIRLSQLSGAELKNDVLVETFIPKGVEALVGVTSSALGKVLTIGVGGVLTEIISDVSIRLLPVDEDTVRQMIAETRLAQLFAGARGSEPADTAAFIAAVLRIAEVASTFPDASELDINPLTVLPQGAWVLDTAYSMPTEVEHR